MPMTDPLGVPQGGSEPAVMVPELAAPAQRHREGTKTSQFVADHGPIGSNAIRMGACPDATATGSIPEAAS